MLLFMIACLFPGKSFWVSWTLEDSEHALLRSGESLQVSLGVSKLMLCKEKDTSMSSKYMKMPFVFSCLPAFDSITVHCCHWLKNSLSKMPIQVVLAWLQCNTQHSYKDSHLVPAHQQMVCTSTCMGSLSTQALYEAALPPTCCDML